MERLMSEQEIRTLRQEVNGRQPEPAYCGYHPTGLRTVRLYGLMGEDARPVRDNLE